MISITISFVWSTLAKKRTAEDCAPQLTISCFFIIVAVLEKYQTEHKEYSFKLFTMMSDNFSC